MNPNSKRVGCHSHGHGQRHDRGAHRDPHGPNSAHLRTNDASIRRACFLCLHLLLLLLPLLPRSPLPPPPCCPCCSCCACCPCAVPAASAASAAPAAPAAPAALAAIVVPQQQAFLANMSSDVGGGFPRPPDVTPHWPTHTRWTDRPSPAPVRPKSGPQSGLSAPAPVNAAPVNAAPSVHNLAVSPAFLLPLHFAKCKSQCFAKHPSQHLAKHRRLMHPLSPQLLLACLLDPLLTE
jgi:hypothetical protein